MVDAYLQYERDMRDPGPDGVTGVRQSYRTAMREMDEQRWHRAESTLAQLRSILTAEQQALIASFDQQMAARRAVASRERSWR